MPITPKSPSALHALLSMRDRELDAARREGRLLAERQMRLARNVTQLTQLYRAVAIGGARARAYSFQNRADYKRALVDMIETQQAPLAQLARWQSAAAQAVREAQRRREGVATLVARHEAVAREARRCREVQEQAELTLVVWRRGVATPTRNEDITLVNHVYKSRTTVALLGETARVAPHAHPEPGVDPCCK
ncbi:flagellar export protein FliJ [Pandoraea pulmonicola]|uniref:Flagellar FliJ protein n=1 Tax=Pandoraea pulmonicola TaxID=93221 RepID=A0AAJ4ZAP9_PANPU|nr:flagellar export protein FliJ [Pandoraea pulmonicola]AJC21361.1 hypothetical protein RO07_14280 [Pandoraea pulmonicola]SUA89909.1 Uncharacterised protein [Pandoraea pulmonicola]